MFYDAEGMVKYFAVRMDRKGCPFGRYSEIPAFRRLDLPRIIPKKPMIPILRPHSRSLLRSKLSESFWVGFSLPRTTLGTFKIEFNQSEHTHS